MSNTVAQLSSDTKIAISLKKLQGKAHTKTENELYNEGLPSGITMDSSTVFGETPPTNPNTGLGDITNNVVEKVRLTCTFIAGSDTPDGKHGFKLSLPADYETTSNNPKKGTGPFLNSAEIVNSNGQLQLVPPSFDYRYEAVPYYGTLTTLSSIPLADPRDWNLDYFNGVLFQQDPPTNTDEDPTYIDAYLYIGKYLTTVVSEAGGTTTFTSLTDTPNNLTGHAGKIVKVNSSENGLEFDTITLPSNFVGDDGDNTVNDEAAGLVPAPVHGDAAAGKYLKADGTWSTPPDTNTTYVSSDFDHDQLTNYEPNEHIDWTQSGVGTIDPSNYTDTTYTSSDFDHNQLTNYVANEHIDWTQAGVGTIDPSNYTNTTYAEFVGDDGDSSVNNEAAGLVPAPYHGDAAAGKFLKADGTWAVPAGGGGGGGGASASGIDKYTVRVSTQTNALTAIQFLGLNTTDVPANASLSVYLNGDLLLEGDVTTVTAFSNQDPRLPSTTNTHYYISSSNELTFGFALVPGDYLVVEKLSFETSSAVTQVNAINGLKQDTNVGNITIEPNYDGATESIIKKAYDGTGITVDYENDFLLLHDVTDDKVKYIKAEQIGSGGTGAGVIGVAEDGSYADGLFADFTPTTPTGTAIDRFNELLKILVPDPAPNLFYTNCRDLTTNAGDLLNSSTRFGGERRFKSAILSFGESNTGAPKYANSTNASSMNPIDTNGVYESTTQGQNIRLGTYLRGTILPTYTKWEGTWNDPAPSEPPSFPEDLRGPLNDSVTADVYANNIVNYRDKVFGNAEVGNLKIHLNGSLLHTSPGLDTLTGRGDPHQLDSTDDPLNRTNWDGANWSDSGFWKISTPQAAKSDGGLSFPIFQNRYAEWLIHPNDMRKGWNWLKIEHSTPSGDYVTNTIEWMVISDEPDIASTAAGTFSNIVGSNIFYLSGVKYFADMTYDWGTTVVNAYDGVYSTTPIDFNVDYGAFTSAIDQNGVDLLAQMPTIGAGEDYTKSINVTSSGAFSYTSASFPTAGLINGSIDVALRVYHPNVGPIVNTDYTFTNPQLDRREWSIRGYEDVGASTLSGLLVWDPTSSNSEILEDFKSESYRQQPGNYDTQADVWTGGNWVTPWDSQELLNGASAGHNTGLIQVSPGELRAPTNTTGVTAGDFAAVTNGPSSNADYSDITTGTRTYYRAFKNTGLAQRDIRFTFDGDASIISNATPFPTNANAIRVYVKIPGKTGWMDTSLQYSLGNNGDNDGAWVLTENNSISGQTYKYVSFGLTTVDQNEYVILRIEADATWTGNLSSIETKFNASSGTESTVPDTCSSLNCTSPDGVTANLSFGASLPIPASDPNHPYENVTQTWSGNIDVNDQYSPYDKRKGVYGSFSQKVGIVNSGENGDHQNFAQYSILYGNEGTMALEVNGVTVHSIDLSSYTGAGVPGSGSATSLETTYNSSGFTNISIARNVTWSDGIPDFRYFVRTMNYQIGPQHQRPGHNWVRVVHTGPAGGPYETNYMEWVVDPDSSTFDITNEEMENWTDTDIGTQSGIKYFQSPSSKLKFRAVGAYSNVYTTRSQAIGWRNLTRVSVDNWSISGAGINNVTGLTLSLVEMPDVVSSIDSLDVTGSISWNGSSKVMPGSLGANSNQSASASARVYHPLKTSGANNYVDASTMAKSSFLIHPGFSDSSTTTSENFSGENYRILSNTDFSLVGNISQGTWDSTIDLSGGTNGYSDGLCLYNGNLVAPANAGSNGDFRNIDDGGSLQGPDGNVDYSSLSGNNERVYIRPFYNGTGQSKSRFDITISGVGTLTSETQSDNTAGPLNSSNFKMFVKIVEPTGSPATTGWLDCGEHSNSSVTDNSGCRYGALNNQLPVNIASTNSFEIIMPSGRDLNAAGSNLLLIKIVANDDWTGRITSLGISL